MVDETDEPLTKKEKLFGQALFDVEHALGIYAFSYCTIPAEGIYDKEALKPLMSVIETCHIYLIGYTPIVTLLDATQNRNVLSLRYSVAGEEVQLPYEIPEGLHLKRIGDQFYVEDSDGRKVWPSMEEVLLRLCRELQVVDFEVKYVGQAYGEDGSRNAVDRLLKHETLQKIALKETPENYRLSLLLLAIQPSNQVITVMNPFAAQKDEASERIQSGLDKLYNTDEKERVALYEASLIRYFYPEYNTEFKDSFPSTNLKVLRDCYDKDFGSVVAEICIDELPFRLFSERVKPDFYHIIKHDLHKDEDRKMFFEM